jgi:hypothetical protein
MDPVTVTQFWAVDQPDGLLADARMAAQGRGERLGGTRALGVAQRHGLGEEGLGVRPQRRNRLAKLQTPLFRVAHQVHQDVPVAAALAAQAAHAFCPLLVEGVGVPREPRGAGAARLRDGGDERQRFLGAVYQVVASVTR